MSDRFWDSFFSSLPQIIISLGTFTATIVTLLRVGTVHKQINSRMDQLLVVTADKYKAEGIKEESERTRQ